MGILMKREKNGDLEKTTCLQILHHCPLASCLSTSKIASTHCCTGRKPSSSTSSSPPSTSGADGAAPLPFSKKSNEASDRGLFLSSSCSELSKKCFIELGTSADVGVTIVSIDAERADWIYGLNRLSGAPM